MVSLIVLSVNPTAQAQQGMSEEERAQRVSAMLAAPNPLEPSDSIWIEELTYMEVRDRIAAGTTTAIIPPLALRKTGHSWRPASTTTFLRHCVP